MWYHRHGRKSPVGTRPFTDPAGFGGFKRCAVATGRKQPAKPRAGRPLLATSFADSLTLGRSEALDSRWLATAQSDDRAVSGCVASCPSWPCGVTEPASQHAPSPGREPHACDLTVPQSRAGDNAGRDPARFGCLLGLALLPPPATCTSSTASPPPHGLRGRLTGSGAHVGTSHMRIFGRLLPCIVRSGGGAPIGPPPPCAPAAIAGTSHMRFFGRLLHYRGRDTHRPRRPCAHAALTSTSYFCRGGGGADGGALGPPRARLLPRLQSRVAGRPPPPGAQPARAGTTRISIIEGALLSPQRRLLGGPSPLHAQGASRPWPPSARFGRPEPTASASPCKGVARGRLKMHSVRAQRQRPPFDRHHMERAR